MKDIIQHTVLSNGLTMYLRRTDLTPNLVYLVLSVKVGSFDDGAKKGIAHLLEHCNMGFEKYRKPLPRRLLTTRGIRQPHIYFCTLTVSREDVRAFMAARPEYTKANRFKDIVVKVYI